MSRSGVPGLSFKVRYVAATMDGRSSAEDAPLLRKEVDGDGVPLLSRMRNYSTAIGFF